MAAGRGDRRCLDGREGCRQCGGAHYFLWEAVRCEPGLRTGDHTMIDRYDRSMRVLTRLLQGWSEYHRSSV